MNGLPNTRLRKVILPAALVLGDTAFAALALGYWLRYASPLGNLGIDVPDATFAAYLPLLLVGVAFLLAAYTQLNLYSDQRDALEFAEEETFAHLDEILSRHDLRRDPWAGSPAEFAARSRRNAENRCLHHHVFDVALQRAIMEECGWIVTDTERVRPLHLLALATRPDISPVA